MTRQYCCYILTRLDHVCAVTSYIESVQGDGVNSHQMRRISISGQDSIMAINLFKIMINLTEINLILSNFVHSGFRFWSQIRKHEHANITKWFHYNVSNDQKTSC